MTGRGAKNLRILSICHFLTQSKTHSNPSCLPVAFCLAPEMKYLWQPWIFIWADHPTSILDCYYGCDHCYNGTHCRFTVKSSCIYSMAISSSSSSLLILHPTHTGRQDTVQNSESENKRVGADIKGMAEIRK